MALKTATKGGQQPQGGGHFVKWPPKSSNLCNVVTLHGRLFSGAGGSKFATFTRPKLNFPLQCDR